MSRCHIIITDTITELIPRDYILLKMTSKWIKSGDYIRDHYYSLRKPISLSHRALISKVYRKK